MRLSDLLTAFKGCDKVIFRLTGCGEQEHETAEFKDAIEAIEALQQENERLADETTKIMKENKQEIDRLKEKLNAVLQDFYQYVQGGKEICAFCLHDSECEPGETICGATYKGFKWRGLNEREDL